MPVDVEATGNTFFKKRTKQSTTKTLQVGPGQDETRYLAMLEGEEGGVQIFVNDYEGRKRRPHRNTAARIATRGQEELLEEGEVKNVEFSRRTMRVRHRRSDTE